ncbi:hypothetical protein Tsp_07117 [Trichinella spiralis]|uniref:hypothetical protein n=1 Tax=Trichinella spiralis TaxID=6334 RepID=UPI0001EFBB6A|nr:hypothetical protein Tsp_07117 [Trichinella spiralis]
MKSRIIVLDKARLDSKKVFCQVSCLQDVAVYVSVQKLTSLASLRQQCKPVFVQGRRPTTGYFVINAFFLRRSHSTYVDKVQQQRVSSLTPLLPRSTQLRQSITEVNHTLCKLFH